MSKASENKKLIDEFKNLNLSTLTQMLNSSPEIFLAFSNVLNQVEKKFIGSSIEDSKEHELANYRIKTKSEFENAYGDDWMNLVLWNPGGGMDWMFGKRLTEIVNDSEYDHNLVLVETNTNIVSDPKKDPNKNEWIITTNSWTYDPESSKKDDSKKQWTSEDFRNIKIIVDTPEKSKKFQELVLSLGIRWLKDDVKDKKLIDKVNNTDKKYLITSPWGELYFINVQSNFKDADAKEIFYDDIFGKEEKPIVEDTTKTKQSDETNPSNYRIKTQEEFEKEFGKYWKSKSSFNVDGKMNWMFGKRITEITPESFHDKLYDYIKSEKTFKSNADLDPESRSWTIHYEMIIYDPIGKQKTPLQQELDVSQVADVSVLSEFYNTKIIVDTPEKSRKFQELIITLGGYVPGEGKSIGSTDLKYAFVGSKGELTFTNDVFYFEKQLYKEIFYDDIFEVIKPKVETIKPKSKSKYQLPIDTVPYALNNVYDFFKKNAGDRNSPTQSAGELKEYAKKTKEKEKELELISTYYRGNDNMWYSILITDKGVWKWNKLSAIGQKTVEAGFINQKDEAEKQKTSTPESTTKDENPGLKKEFYRDTKIRVKNPNQSINLQRFFNKIGIEWKTGGVIKYEKAPFLFVDEKLNLGYSFDEKYFEDSAKEELSYKSILPLIKQTVLDYKMK
jgi:hypothetical protein